MGFSSNPERARFFSVATGVGLAACWLFAVNLQTQRCAIVDDAFISFRFARHLMQGHGLVWNIGEAPVEGASNLSLVLLLALLQGVLGQAFDMVRLAEAIGVLSALGAAFAIWLAIRDRVPAPAAWLVTGLYLALPSTAAHARGGLETNLYTCALAFWVMQLQRYAVLPTRGRLWALLVPFSLTMLSRPEGGLVAGTALGGWLAFELLVQRDRTRALAVVRLGTACAGILGAYGLWKLIYFGTLLSPPYWVKAATTTHALPGLAYVALFVVGYGALWLLFVIGLLRERSARETWIAAAVVLANTLVYVLVAPVVAFEGRYLVPVLPALLIVAAPVIAQLLALTPTRVQPAIALLGLLLLVPQNLNPPGTSFIELGRLLFRKPAAQCTENWTGRNRQIGKRLALLKHPGARGAVFKRPLRVLNEDIGAVGYETDAQIFDPVGLTSENVARASSARALADLAFGFEPDVIILRRAVDKEAPPGTGHGAIDRFGKDILLRDPRFSAYQHVLEGDAAEATYRWHFWVRTHSPYAAQLPAALAGYERQRLE